MGDAILEAILDNREFVFIGTLEADAARLSHYINGVIKGILSGVDFSF
tara:strand:- start:18899 stop:19042 length:144 start_codon:yes stop_codon:yes gene_type:complete